LIHVKDVVAANAFFALRSQATGVFNVACGRQITITDLALTIRNLTKSSSTIAYDAERPGDVKHSVAGVDKIQAAGFRPVTDLFGGLCTTIEFFKKELGALEQGRHV
jgi:UDP-glucose 4-epimerase